MSATEEHDPGGKARITLPLTTKSDASFSPCGRYRYTLSRQWDQSLPTIMFVLMNPSIADRQTDDPTIAKCTRLAKQWGYGRLLVGNICGYRATDRDALLSVDDPVGPDNLAAILGLAAQSAQIVVAHGVFPKSLQHHVAATYGALEAAGVVVHTMKLTIDGTTPRHPRFLREDLSPQVWTR